MKPSGVWATRPIRPPDRVTRASSLAVRSWFGREHRPEDGADDVEAAVAEREILGVALDELHLEASASVRAAGALEQRRDVVQPTTLAAPSGRGHGGVAAAGCDVEDALGRVDVERLDEELGHDEDLRADHVVVAAGPGRLLAHLDGGEIRSGGGAVVVAVMRFLSVLPRPWLVDAKSGRATDARHRETSVFLSCRLFISPGRRSRGP